jgi:hypothetical protein
MIYRITSTLKFETDNITIIKGGMVGQTIHVILVVMYVEIFRTDVIVFIGEHHITFRQFVITCQDQKKIPKLPIYYTTICQKTT